MPSVVKITNQAGNVVAERLYDAFGNVLSESGDWSGFPFGFHPNWLEFKAGKHSFYLTPGGRIYDPTLGRFLQRDPYTCGPDDPRILEAGIHATTILVKGSYEALLAVAGNRNHWKILGAPPVDLERLHSRAASTTTEELRSRLKAAILKLGGRIPHLSSRNAYAFPGNDPVNVVDPTGNITLVELLLLLALLSLLAAILIPITARARLALRGRAGAEGMEDVTSSLLDLRTALRGYARAESLLLQAYKLIGTELCNQQAVLAWLQERGCLVVGERGIFFGGPVGVGRILPRGQQNIIDYIENSPAFNSGKNFPPSPSLYHGVAIQYAFDWTDAEISRARTAQQWIRQEINRRRRGGQSSTGTS